MNNGNKIVKVIELKGKLGSLEKSLSTLRQNLSGLQLPKDVEKTFSGLDEIIKTLQHRVSEGIISREEFKVVEKEVGQVVKRFGELAGSVESIQQLSAAKKLSLLPEDAKEKLQAATSAMEQYSSTLSSIIKLENEQAAASERVANAEARVKAAETNEKTAKEAVDTIQAQIDKHTELTAALEEQEKAEKQYAEAVKQLEKAKSSGMGAKAIKNRESKVAQADAEREKARLVVSLTKEGMEPEEIREYEEAVSALTEKKKEYTAASRELADAQKVQTEAQGTLATIQTQLKQATEEGADGANEQKKAYETLLKAIKQVNPEFEDVAEAGETTTERLARLSKIVEGLSDEELKKLEQSLGGVSGTVKETQDAVDGLSGSLQNAKKETKESDEEAGKVHDLEQRIKAFLGVQGAVELMRRAMRDAFATVKELDSAMREMAVVTDLSVGDYWRQLPEYAERASNLGVSIKSAYEAATLYYQQGLKTNEVTALSTQTLKMASIAGIEAEDATNKMTAALRGFNMELNETSAQRIADVYSELAAITAADVDQISSAMTKTASIASSAGMEFETTAAFLSQIIETTQESAETAGTAMKTVIARFQELKKAPSEIGEVDGEIVDANAIETALRSVGVSLRDASGQFRELDDVFLELSSKWDGLDKNTQRYIATIAAGSRQQSRFIAMMSNYGRTQELVTAANNSAGASAKQYEKTLESLRAKLNKLKNAWDQFTMGIMNDNLVKFGVDLLTKFLQVVNKATDGLDSVGNSITRIASVLVIFKTGSKIFEKFKPMIHKFLSGIIKEFQDAGFNAGKRFAEGVKAGTTGKTPEDNPEMTEEEKKKKENFEKRLEKTRSSLAASGRGEMQSPLEAIKTAVGKKKQRKADIAEKKRLQEELSDLIATEELARGEGSNADYAEAHEERVRQEQRIQEIDARIGEKPKSVVLEKAAEWIGVDDFAKSRGAFQEAGASKSKAVQAQETLKQIQAQDTRQRELSKTQVKRDLRVFQLEEKQAELMIDLTAEEKEELQRLYKEQKELDGLEQNASKRREKAAEKEREFNEESEKYLKKKQEGWDNFEKGVKSAGEAMIGFGTSLSVVGGILEQAGFEEGGELLSKIGQYATIAGTAIAALAPIIKFIGNAIVTEGGKIAIMGGTVQLAWWWVMIIVAVIAALIVLIAVLIKKSKDNSPEKKLERLEQQTEAAKNAADEAADSYNNLQNAISEISDNRDVFKNLIKGTKEWKKALSDNNLEILKLIETYPELNQFVKRTEDGILYLDTESRAYEQYMQEQSEKVMLTQQVASALNAQTKESTKLLSIGWTDLGEEFQAQVETKKRELETTHSTEDYAAATGLYENKGKEQQIAELNSIVAQKDSFQNELFDLYKRGLLTNNNGNWSVSDSAGKTELEKEMILASLKKTNEADFVQAMQTYENYSDLVSTNLKILADTVALNNDLIKKENQNISTFLSQESTHGSSIGEQAYEKYEKEFDEKLKQAGTDSNGNVNGDFYENIAKEVYGQDASYKDGKIYDASGNIIAGQDTALDSNYFKALYANKKYGEFAFDAALNFDNIIGEITELSGLENGAEKLLEKAIREGVEGLTIDETAYLKEVLHGGDFDSLSENSALRSVFQDNSAYEDYLINLVNNKELDYSVKQLSNSLSNPEKIKKQLSFARADELEVFSQRLVSLQDRGISQEGIDGVYTSITNDFLNKFGEDGERVIDIEDRQKVLSRILETDFSSVESLTTLNNDLINQYRISADEVKILIDNIAGFSHATSYLITTISEFGELERASQKLNKALDKQAELQWELDKAMSEGDAAGVKGAYSGLINNLNEQLGTKEEVVLGAKNNLAKAIAQGGEATKFGGRDLRNYININQDGTVDTSSLMQALERGEFGNDAESVEEWLKLINESQDALQAAEEDMRNHLATIEELEQQGAEAYDELREMAETAILDSLQKQIDIEQDTLDATKDANALLISKIQEQIDKTREDREKEEAEKNISDMYSQMAYLSSDTSGSNALALLDQEEALKQTEQSYQDTLIDQSLQNLQEANAKAEEQRERQITLAQQQLDAYVASGEFQDHVDAQLAEMLAADEWMKTNLGGLIVGNAKKGMNASQIDGYLKTMQGKVGLSQKWKGTDWETYKTDLEGKLDLVKDAVSNIEIDASDLKTAQQKSDLTVAGFNSEKINNLEEKDLNTLSDFVSKEGSTTSIDDMGQKLSDANITGVSSKAEYYQGKMEDILDGKEVPTYEEYLANIIEKEQKNAIDKAQGVANSSTAGLKGLKNNDTYKSALDTYTKLGGDATIFEQTIKSGRGYINSGHFPDGSGVVSSRNTWDSNWSAVTIKIGDSSYEVTVPKGELFAQDDLDETLRSYSGASKSEVTDGWIVMHEGEPYVYWGGHWKKITGGHQGLNGGKWNTGYTNLKSAMLSHLNSYKTGGLADFTGPAWLDGTPSKPEYILNAAQTERFFSLIDVLEGLDNKESGAKPSGDNYFDIDINVEKIEDDYDLEQIANKIRGMIYQDAAYRNVNSINLIR